MSEVKTELTPVQQNQLTMSERFTAKVLQEYGGSVAGALEVTDYQRTLISGYFICDRCGDDLPEGELYEYDGDELCSRCILKSLDTVHAD